MLLLDTNVLSEVMRSTPDQRVMAWLDQHPLEDFATTAICAAEIEAGIANLPEGRRKHDLEADWADLKRALLLGGIIAFDQRAAPVYGRFRILRKRAGISLDEFDLLIAAIAADLGAAMVTRNTADFDGLGLVVHNPWGDAASP